MVDNILYKIIDNILDKISAEISDENFIIFQLPRVSQDFKYFFGHKINIKYCFFTVYQNLRKLYRRSTGKIFHVGK